MLHLAPAKINLSLDVIRKREDGYHELSMIMQTISLYDKIEMEKNKNIVLDSNDKNMPLDERNLVYKAAKAFFEYTSIDGGCDVYIEKNIPSGAGLGGGSSDAAETLIMLNELYGAGLTQAELCEIAVKIGADVPFFIIKGTCLAEGIGEKLTVIENNTDPYILVYKPEFSISTKWVYENLNLQDKKERDIGVIISALKDGDRRKLCDNIFNVLEDVSVKKYSEIDRIKTDLKNMGAMASMMTGSGSAVFGIFYDENKAKQALEHYKNEQIFLTKYV